MASITAPPRADRPRAFDNVDAAEAEGSAQTRVDLDQCGGRNNGPDNLIVNNCWV